LKLLNKFIKLNLSTLFLSILFSTLWTNWTHRY